jgi:hypothetical protein
VKVAYLIYSKGHIRASKREILQGPHNATVQCGI